jgi:hypothetical protein
MLCIGYAEGQSVWGATTEAVPVDPHPGLSFRTMRSLSSGRPKARPVGIAGTRIADAKHRRSFERRRPEAAYALPTRTTKGEGSESRHYSKRKCRDASPP